MPPHWARTTPASWLAPTGRRTLALCASGDRSALCRRKSSRPPRPMSVPTASSAAASGTSCTTHPCTSSAAAPAGATRSNADPADSPCVEVPNFLTVQSAAWSCAIQTQFKTPSCSGQVLARRTQAADAKTMKNRTACIAISSYYAWPGHVASLFMCTRGISWNVAVAAARFDERS